MPRPAKAIYVTSIKDIPSDARAYGRVYFGAEFCQWRLPAPSAVVRAYGRASSAGLGFTLVTPWLTGAGMKKLRKILDALSGAASNGKTEVVVNDFGALSVVASEYKNFEPVLGRLLTRQKRCPRIPGIIDELPGAGRELYLHAGVEDAVIAKLIRRYGVKRVELDNPLQGMGVSLRDVKLKGSIYTPYAYVTVTRHCPASFDGSSWQSFTGCRIKGCLHNVVRLTNPEHAEPLVMRGNAQFVESATLPEDLAGMGIDRIVVMEDVP